MTEPTPDVDPWRRLHPLSPLLRGGLVALVIGGILVANLRDRIISIFVGDEFAGTDAESDVIDVIVEQGFALLALGLALAVIAIIVFFAWLSWRFHTFRITDEAVESRSGVLFRQHRRAPLDRIQSVNLQRPLLARALGLTQVDVQTAGQGGKVALSYLGYRDAKAVREAILRRASEQQTAGHPVQAGQGLQDPAPPFRGGSQSADHAAAAGDARTLPGQPASALEQELDRRAHDFIDADIDAEATAAGTLVTVPPGRLVGSVILSWEFSSFMLLSIASGVLGATGRPVFLTLLIPFVLAAIGLGFRGVNRGWGFTLSRGRDSVRIGAGLTATNTETIPFGRIHAVQAKQPLFWRPFGWWQVRVTTAGHSVAQGGQGATGNLVLPVGLEADVVRVIETLLPGSVTGADEEAELRNAVSGPGAGFVHAGPRAGWVLWFARRRAGLQLAGEGDLTALRIRSGALTRGLSIIPIVRVQSVLFHRPLVHRMIGLAGLQAHTVLGPVRTQIYGLELDRARAVFDEVSATVVRVQLAEAPNGIRARRAVQAPGAGDVHATPQAQAQAQAQAQPQPQFQPQPQQQAQSPQQPQSEGGA